MKGVIVEGIDCSGKSSLIKVLKYKLKNQGGFDVKELEHVNNIQQYKRYMFEYVTSQRILFDRSHISEVVYGKILRSNNPFSDEELMILNQVVNLDYLVVYAKPSYDDFVDRMKKTRDSQVIKAESYNSIIEGFEEIMKFFNPIIYSSKSFEELEVISNKVVHNLSNDKNDK